ncbi:hypothetical protein ABID74_000869 [Gordonia terrae]
MTYAVTGSRRGAMLVRRATVDLLRTASMLCL